MPPAMPLAEQQASTLAAWETDGSPVPFNAQDTTNSTQK